MSNAADRQRLRRARARHGLRVVAVEVSADGEAALMRAGLLAEWDCDDRCAVGHAIERLLGLLAADSRHV